MVLRRALCVASLGLALASGCGPKLPPRFVVERDIADARYRRYQKVLDVEVPIQNNPAVGHTATYAQRGSTLHITPVFVTSYEKAHGLTETVRMRLRAMTGYDVLPRELAGENVWYVSGEEKDRWIIWISNQHMVKVGIPEGADHHHDEILEAYLDLYPSDLDEHGHVQPGAKSAGAAVVPAPEK